MNAASNPMLRLASFVRYSNTSSRQIPCPLFCAMPAIEPRVLISAYCSGIFPMGMENGRLSWFSPDPRGILPIANFHVPRNTRAELRRAGFVVQMNKAFGQVVRSCAARRETWITREIINSYELLHKMGYAHSGEAWKGEELVGGLYGVSIGGAFFG